MKEASGELNMTLVTILAIAAIAAIFTAFVYPTVKNRIQKSLTNTTGGLENNIHDSETMKPVD